MRTTESFTASGIAEAETRVRSDLDCIADAILKTYPSTRTVAVVGAFGRGEGAVVRRGDRYVPWNDYDLFMICDNRSGWGTLGTFGKEMAARLGIPSIDILPMLPGDIVRNAGTMPVFDACHGNRILRGDESLLSPDTSTGIDPREVYTLCVNRMVCLLETPPATLTGVPPDPLKYTSQVSKVIFAVMDAVLYHAGNYVTSYREKTSRFLELDGVPAAMKTAAEEALSFRLDPRALHWGESMWFMASNHLLENLLRFVSKSDGDIHSLVRHHWRTRFGSLETVLRKLVSGTIPDCSCRAVECAEILLLASAKPDSTRAREAFLDLAVTYLKKTDAAFDGDDWKSTGEAVVTAWFRYCHA